MTSTFLLPIRTFADGIRWSNGANRNRVYGNTIRVGSDSKARFAFYMCEWHTRSAHPLCIFCLGAFCSFIENLPGDGGDIVIAAGLFSFRVAECGRRRRNRWGCRATLPGHPQGALGAPTDNLSGRVLGGLQKLRVMRRYVYLGDRGLMLTMKKKRKKKSRGQPYEELKQTRAVTNCTSQGKLRNVFFFK